MKMPKNSMYKPILLILVGVVALIPASVWGEELPNVVMIMVDDMGWSEVAAYRRYQGLDDPFPTPNIDRLVSEGMMFTDAHSPAALCAPTRFSMLTGSNPPRNGREIGTWAFTASPNAFNAGGRKHITVGEVAQAAGYRTAFFGKMHLGGGDDNLEENMPAFPLTYGFDYHFNVPGGIQDPPYCYFENGRFVKIDPADPLNPSVPGYNSDLTGWVAGSYPGPNGTSIIQDTVAGNHEGTGDINWDTSQNGIINSNKAIAFIDDHLATYPTQPFMIYYCPPQCHLPHSPPIDFNPNADGTSHDPADPNFVPVEGVTAAASGNAHSDVLIDIDLQVGKILAKLEDPDGDGDQSDSILSDTLVMFTSDNGGLGPNYTPAWYDSTGVLSAYKAEPYEGGHRVPFIARWGDGTPAGSVIEPNSVSDELIISHDWVGIMYDLTGQSIPADQALDCANILPILDGTSSGSVRDFALLQGNVSDEAASYQPNTWVMRQGDYVLIMDRTSNRNPQELYNLATDLAQTTNLIGNPAYTTIINDMHTLYLAYNGANDPRSTTAYVEPSTDTDPPTPDAPTFAVAPTASVREISMTATTGTDASGIVWYYFDETSGKAGGSDSGWQISPEYTDDGLLPGTEYTYTVKMRDALLNTTAASTPAGATTEGPTPNNWVSNVNIAAEDIPAWLDTSGMLVKASNLKGAASVTVGGVPFDSDTSNLSDFNIATIEYYTGTDTDLAALLNNQGARWSTFEATISFAGLTPGREYRMQMISGEPWGWAWTVLIGPWGETVQLQATTKAIHVSTLLFTPETSDVEFKVKSVDTSTAHAMAYSLYSTSIPGDLAGDGKVNLEDLAELGTQWQSGYDMDTLLDIANNWLYGTSP